MNSLTQPSSHPRMRELLDSLDFSCRAELISQMLHTLYEIADVLAGEGEKARAFEILNLVAQYPLHGAMVANVDMLLDDLEFQLCPRVVADARQRANDLTLDDLAAELLEQSA